MKQLNVFRNDNPVTKTFVKTKINSDGTYLVMVIEMSEEDIDLFYGDEEYAMLTVGSGMSSKVRFLNVGDEVLVDAISGEHYLRRIK